MIAYKFLRSGRTGPFSQFSWPEPGVWVHADRDPAACRSGVHACRTKDLPWWLAEELWEVELDGEIRVDEHKLVASAGRLRSQVEQWAPVCARQYGEACAWRGRDRAVQTLARAAHDRAAGELAKCATLDEVLLAARRLAAYLPDARIGLTIAGDGVACALAGAPAASAYVAAQAALRLDGPVGYAAERAWQSAWLVGRLGLSAHD